MFSMNAAVAHRAMCKKCWSYGGLTARFHRLVVRPLTMTLLAGALIESSHALALGPDVQYGGYFDDGASHVVPPNLSTSDAIMVGGPSRVGAFVSTTSQLTVTESGKVTVDAPNSADAYGVYAVDSAVIKALASSQISVGEGSGGIAVGIFAGGASAVDVFPMALLDVHENASGDGIGLFAEQQSVVSFRGTLDLSDAGNGSAVVAHSTGDSRIIFGGSATASEVGNEEVVGFLAGGFSRIDFDGAMTLSEFGNGDALPFHLTENAHLSYRGAMTLNEDGNSIRAGALVQDDAIAELSAGSLTIRSDGLGFSAQLVMLELNDRARVRIVGGVYRVFEDSIAQTPFVKVNAQSELRIRGTSFNYPLGAVPDAAGLLTGVLSDGQSISFAFAREASAAIVLVPEPAASRLFAIGSILAASGSRRRR